MGDYYRNDEVILGAPGAISEEEFNFIVNLKRNPDIYSPYASKYKLTDVGTEPSKIKHHMTALFDFMESNDIFNSKSKTDLFIKSQIMHFYFVYVHPYFDINGRTARTTSMWYLINNKNYPFIIFNRAITLAKKDYYRVIRDVRKFHNITFFLNYMMKNTLLELEKEHLMELIGLNLTDKLTSLDFQTLHYILSMKGNITYADFSAFYNSQNEKKSNLTIYKTMIETLLDKRVIIQGRKTNHGFTPMENNYFFGLNGELYDSEDPKIKHLELSRVTSK